MKKIVLFKGKLETLNIFNEQLKKGFEELGNYEIYVFDMQESQKSLYGFYKFLEGSPITAMIAFNSNFYSLQLPSGANLFEELRIPCINILVDHPYWYSSILDKMPSTGIVLCIDRGHMDFVNRFYPRISINGFLPHGGTPMKDIPKSIKNRKIDVLYAGSLYAYYADTVKSNFKTWDFPVEKICESAIQTLIDNPYNIIESVFEETARAYGLNITEETFDIFTISCEYIDRVVSSYYREKVLSSIALAGISLELYGAGWDDCSWITLPNVHYRGMISPRDILNKMEDSKIVLNTMPWFRDGSHERVFNVLRGACVCSETSKYFEEILPSDVWMPYDLTHAGIETLAGRINSILQNPEEMQKIATKGYELAAVGHTWQSRAKELHEDLLMNL